MEMKLKVIAFLSVLYMMRFQAFWAFMSSLLQKSTKNKKRSRNLNSVPTTRVTY